MASVRRWGAAAAARQHLLAGLLLGLLVLVYLWPVLVGGKILSPIADLYGSVPWKPYAPSDLKNYYSPVLVDIPLVDYPWRVLARELIRDGTFPAWNPYALSGIPFYSNPQTGLFTPFSLPLWLLPLTYGLGVAAALKLLVAGFGTYLLARQLRLSLLPGVLAGVAFAFSASNVVWLSHETLPAVIALLPWAIWLVERIFERGRVGSAIGLAVAIAIGLGGGHPGMQVHLLLVTTLYALARAACSLGGERTRRRDVLARLALVGGGIAAGVLLMAFMLLPEARSSDGTVGVLARQGGILPGENMPLAALKTVLFPDWWGRPSAFELPSEGGRNPFGFVNYNERTFYAGTVALLLAGVGLLARERWRAKAPFVVLGAIGLAIPLHARGTHWLVTHTPVLKSVSAQRLLFAFGFAVALLAAFGLQALLDAPRRRQWLVVPVLATYVGIRELQVAHAAPRDLRRTVAHFLTGVDHARAGVLALTSIAWFALFALGVAAALLLMHVRPRWRVGIALALVLLAAGDAYHFAHGLQPMGPASKVIPPVTPAIAYLERHPATRFVGLNGALPNDWALLYGLRDVRGYDPPQPTARMLRLWQIVSPGQPPWVSFVAGPPNDRAARILSVLGTRYLIAEPEFAIPHAVAGRLRRVYHGRDATVMANAESAPRTLVPARTLVTTDERATRAAIGERRFDPRTMAAAERDQPGVGALAAADSEPVHGSATVVRERNAGVTLQARLDRRGLVVLNDALTAGWSVHVDGRPAPPLYVNDVMRGVIVGPGRHTIVWSYEVPGLRLGALLSLLALALLTGTGIVLGVRGRRADALRLPSRAS
ncbi:MAG TPA: hypothetical protein VE972_09520 [Conexibacter sp.]|nr:hypothetical protein [Conexibacter sp.]